jgi:hypothetical protein
MSIATDRADAATLDYIGRNPGVKRRNGRGQANVMINNAATVRLQHAGLVTVTGGGALYLTERGTEAVWAPAPRPAGGGDHALMPSKVMRRMTPAAVKLADPFAVSRTMIANGYAGYAHPASAGNGRTPDAPQACGLDGCDCHRPATVVLDGRFGRGVTHQCSGTWSPPLGQNAGGHDVHQCDGTTTHRYIGAHRVAGHQCGTECASATVTS